MYCFLFYTQPAQSLPHISFSLSAQLLSLITAKSDRNFPLICLFLCALLPLLLILYLPLSLSFPPLLLSDGWLCSRSAGWHRACLEQYVPIKFTLSHCFLKLNGILLSCLFVCWNCILKTSLNAVIFNQKAFQLLWWQNLFKKAHSSILQEKVSILIVTYNWKSFHKVHLKSAFHPRVCLHHFHTTLASPRSVK